MWFRWRCFCWWGFYFYDTILDNKELREEDGSNIENVEEALANAVYHKAYDVREPIEVRVEKDKIEIGKNCCKVFEGIKRKGNDRERRT